MSQNCQKREGKMNRPKVSPPGIYRSGHGKVNPARRAGDFWQVSRNAGASGCERESAPVHIGGDRDLPPTLFCVSPPT